MRLKVFPSSIEFSLPLPLFTSSSCSKKHQADRTSSFLVLSNSFVLKNLLKFQSCTKISRDRKIRRSCSANLGEIYHEESYGLDKNFGETNSEESEGGIGNTNKTRFTASRRSPFTGKFERDRDSFLDSRFDLLEPMMLGVRPEFTNWPDQETVIWATIEQKAKSLEIPLSLRMIKKKLRCEDGFIECKDPTYCSVKAAFSSMVCIIVELQSYALQMREALCREDLEIIINKVQKEMNSSFVWLFQQVFSRTPSLMLYVMILLADFSVYSAFHHVAIEDTSSRSGGSHEPKVNMSLDKVTQIQTDQEIKPSICYPSRQSGSVVEINLWKSMVDEATKIREVIDHDTMQHFVSPVSVEIESDVYEDYLRTDLVYQMNLSLEPNNPLLLCNYAQFLHLVAHDYRRAEECFKKAVQISPPDAESLSLYANFLWTVRRDFWAAEERYLQALATEPDNSYYASRYANFLWNTGGDETCFPSDNSL